MGAVSGSLAIFNVVYLLVPVGTCWHLLVPVGVIYHEPNFAIFVIFCHFLSFLSILSIFSLVVICNDVKVA